MPHVQALRPPGVASWGVRKSSRAPAGEGAGGSRDGISDLAGFGSIPLRFDLEMHKSFTCCSFFTLLPHFNFISHLDQVRDRVWTSSRLARVPRFTPSSLDDGFSGRPCTLQLAVACALCANFLGSRTLPFLRPPRTSYDLLGPPRTS